MADRRYRMPQGVGAVGPIPGEPGNPTDVQSRDPALERTIRRSNFKNWYPFYHWLQFFGLDAAGLNPGQQLLAALVANGNLLRFFVNVPQDLTLCNLRQDAQTPFPFDAYGIGLGVKGIEVFNVAEDPAVDPFIGISFRQLVVEHTRLEFRMRDATTLVNHWGGLIMPGFGVSGGVASTSNDTDRMQDVHGVPHPAAFYRFGGPDRGEVEQLDKGDLVEGTLHFDQVAMATLGAWFPEESPQVPKLALAIGMFLYGWSHRKLF